MKPFRCPRVRGGRFSATKPRPSAAISNPAAISVTVKPALSRSDAATVGTDTIGLVAGSCRLRETGPRARTCDLLPLLGR